MTHRQPSEILVIGIGNRFRRDDAVGLLVAEVIRASNLECVRVELTEGDGAGLIELFRAYDSVIIVDATRSGGSSGEVVRLDAAENSLPSRFFHYSTHAFGLAEAVEMARTLGQLPSHCVVFGIEGEDFAAGQQLSQAVQNALPKAVSAVLDEIRRPKNATIEQTANEC